MKTRIQKLLVGAALVGGATLVQAQFTYTDNGDGTCTITGYTGLGSAIAIPNSINGLTVVRIGSNAFYEYSLATVTIPNTVTSIGNWAFYNCRSLTDATILASATSIGDYAFADCYSLTNVTLGTGVLSIGASVFSDCYNLPSITIPASVTNISGRAFDSCTSLAAITVDAANSFYCSIDGVLFDKNQTALVTFPPGWGAAYKIPDSVTSIGDYAFADCYNVTNVTIGNRVMSIGASAFYNCTRLAGITIPDSVTSIGTWAFYDCAALTNVIIGNSLTSIGANAFYYCTHLATLTLPDSLTSIGAWAFSDCYNLTNFAIPDRVTSIGDYAFRYCTSLTSVAIPGSVASIGSGAFVICTNLTSVTIGSGVTNIGDASFGNCTSLTSVAIPASVTNLGDYAFAGCSGLTAITADPANSFYSSVEGVLFDKNHTTLLQFPGGRSGSYTIPDSITSIGDRAFWYCRLTSVTIGSGLTSIADGQFADCYSLTSLTIPATVTSIGSAAFYDCSSLRAAYFLGNAPPDPGDAFDGDYRLDPVTVYYLPGATGWGSFWSDVPTELWNPQASALRVAGGHFGFDITGPSNTVIVVEACTNLVQPLWLPVSTNALNGGGASSFSDSQSGLYPARFYRFRLP